MKLKVLNEKYNPLMKRKEVDIEVVHEKAGTPDRSSLRKDLIIECKSEENNLYIINFQTQTGTNRSICYAEIYDDAEYAREVLPKYIINRNFPPKEEEKPKEEKSPTEKPPEEKKHPEEKPDKQGKPLTESPTEEMAPEEKPVNQEKAVKEEKPLKKEQPSKERKGSAEKPSEEKKGLNGKPEKEETKEEEKPKTEKPPTEKPPEEKPAKKEKWARMSDIYECDFEKGTIKLMSKKCSRCGKIMACHKSPKHRWTCGSCSYTEFVKIEEK